MKVTELILVCALIVGGASRLHAQPVEVAERSIADEARDMAAGRVTSEGLVKAYLSRIEAYDQKGPALNALITLNPNALNEARALDRERRTTGPRGPLHGVPVIVKDNYSTADLQTTAGTLALLGFVPDRDAFQVRKLREAGAVIIGKSNLHELASGITTVGSAFGAARNPYDPTRTPGGSSGGTAAAVAASPSPSMIRWEPSIRPTPSFWAACARLRLMVRANSAPPVIAPISTGACRGTPRNVVVRSTPARLVWVSAL